MVESLCLISHGTICHRHVRLACDSTRHKQVVPSHLPAFTQPTSLSCYFAIKLRPRYGLISIPITITIGVLFSTVYLGQHYLVDLAAGAAVAILAILASTRIVGQHGNLLGVNPT